MMMIENNDLYKEVLTYLGCFSSELIEKIPTEIFQKLKELSADSTTEFYIEPGKAIDEQNMSDKCKDLISLIYYLYIVDDNSKKELAKKWEENEN